MDIKNLISQRVPAFTGQCSALTHALADGSEAEKIENFVSRRSRLRKIWGADRYAEAGFGEGHVQWLDYFRNRWFFQRGSCIGAETAEDSAVLTNPGQIALGASNRVFSEKWQDTLYMSNGAENKFFQSNFLGESFLNVGLVPPGLGKRTVAATQTGPVLSEVAAPIYGPGGIGAGAYGAYLVTWWDNVRRVESMPYLSYVGEDGLWNAFLLPTYGNSITVIAASGTAVRVNIAAIKAMGVDPRATHFIIYRATADDPTVFKRVADPIADDGTTPTTIDLNYYDDVTQDEDLGAVLDSAISPPPSGKYYGGLGTEADVAAIGPRFVRYHRNQLWYFGVNFPGTASGVEVVSNIDDPLVPALEMKAANYFPFNGMAYGSEVGSFDYFRFSYEVGRETGEEDTFMGKHGNTLMFFKSRSAYYLDGSSPDNYEVREMHTKRGITVSGSAQETSIGIIGLGAEGFTLFDSVSGGQIISEKIADVVERINLEHADKISSSFDPQEEKYECHCPMLNTYNTLVFIYDVKSRSWSFTKKAGGAAAYGLSSDKRVVGLLGDKQNGRLFVSTNRAATTFDGQTMHGIWRKMFDFGRPEALKGVQYVTIVARARRDFRLSVDLIPDFAQRECVSVHDVDPDVRNDVLGEDEDDEEGAVWDEAQWAAGTTKKEFTILIQAIGKKFELVIRNSDTDADRAMFELEEVILWAGLMEGEDSK